MDQDYVSAVVEIIDDADLPEFGRIGDIEKFEEFSRPKISRAAPGYDPNKRHHDLFLSLQTRFPAAIEDDYDRIYFALRSAVWDIQGVRDEFWGRKDHESKRERLFRYEAVRLSYPQFSDKDWERIKHIARF